ncbi:hypothetical protein [Streptomyces sp. BRA346]
MIVEEREYLLKPGTAAQYARLWDEFRLDGHWTPPWEATDPEG